MGEASKWERYANTLAEEGLRLSDDFPGTAGVIDDADVPRRFLEGFVDEERPARRSEGSDDGDGSF